MNKAAEKTPLLTLLFVSLLITTADVRTEEFNKSNTGSLYSQIENSIVSTWAVLEHNRRLLDGTTIGDVLKKTTNSQARHHYTQARWLYDKAIITYQSGQEELARDLAFQSIHAIYKSDRLHYNLTD
jgi:hypothetical protein